MYISGQSFYGIFDISVPMSFLNHMREFILSLPYARGYWPIFAK